MLTLNKHTPAHWTRRIEHSGVYIPSAMKTHTRAHTHTQHTHEQHTHLSCKCTDIVNKNYSPVYVDDAVGAVDADVT